jgi:predicted acylesterase/phospholipase RssA
MSLPQRVRPEGRGYTVLCFDGGGYRGYASLLILKNILRRLQPEGPVFPYLYFDLICGTSTGGLIAILLAVLHLDIDTAIRAFVMLGKMLFNSHLRGPRYLLQNEKFNRNLLKKALSKILDAYGRGRTLMEDRRFDRGCRVCHPSSVLRDPLANK